MGIDQIKTDKAPSAIGPYVQGQIFGELIFTSGQVPLDPETMKVVEGGIKEQSKRTMENLKAVLEEGGGSMDSILKTTCFLSDMANFSAFNEVYGTYFKGNPPARSCVAVKELPKQVLIEVEAIAVKKEHL